VFIPLWSERLQDGSDKALSDRHGGARNAFIIGETYGWLFGLGPGNYPKALEEYAQAEELVLAPWEPEPVHSTPLLFTLEWGLLLLGAVSILLIGYLAWSGSVDSLLLLGLLPTLFLDHYWLTHAGALIYLAVAYSLLTSRVTMMTPWRVPQSLQSRFIDRKPQMS